MSGRVFIDTDVLVYAYDRDAPAKRARAWDVLEQERVGCVLSPQVMMEFFATVTRKPPHSLSERDAEAAIRDLTGAGEIVSPDRGMVLAALAMSQRDHVSIWDALVIQCALAARCTRLLSGDMQHGRRFGDLTIENPFQDVD